MVRRLLSWTLVFVLAATAGPLFAQEKTATKQAPKAAAAKAPAAQATSPLKAIPGDAAVVVRVKGYQSLLGKVAALANAVQPGSGATITLFGSAVGGPILNPTLDGVNMDGEFFLAVFAEKEKQPGFVFVVPGSDLPAMKETLGDSVTFVEVGKHGVYSQDEELVNAVKEQLKSKEKDSLADAIDAKSAAVMNRGDISVFVNVPHLLEVYKDEFQQAQGAIENISQAEKPANAPPGVNWEALMGSMQTFVGKLLKAVEDHEGITIAIAVTEKDVVIENYFKLEEESESGKALKGGTGSDMAMLNGLPAGSMGYYGVQCDLNSAASSLVKFALTVVADEKAKSVMEDALKEIQTIKFNGAAGAFSLGGKTGEGALQGVSIINLSDPARVRTIAKKYAESMKSFEANNTKTEVTYKADAEKIGTTSIDQSISTITISDDAPDADKQKKMLQFMYGDGPITARMAYLKDKVVQTIGGGKASMEAALKQADSRTPNAAIQSARAKLGTKPNFVALVDIASFTVQALKMAKAMEGDLPLPFDPEAIATSANLKPSYTGFAVEVEDAAVSLKTVVTLEQIKSIGDLAKKISAAQQAGN